MVRRLEFDVWSNAVVTQVNLCLEVHRIRVWNKPGIEPSEKRADVAALFDVGKFDPFDEARFTEGHPDSPAKLLALVVYRDVDAASDKEPRLVNDTIVRAETAAALTLELRDLVITQRRIGAKRWHSLVNLSASYAGEFECHSDAAKRLRKATGYSQAA